MELIEFIGPQTINFLCRNLKNFILQWRQQWINQQFHHLISQSNNLTFFLIYLRGALFAARKGIKKYYNSTRV